MRWTWKLTALVMILMTACEGSPTGISEALEVRSPTDPAVAATDASEKAWAGHRPFTARAEYTFNPWVPGAGVRCPVGTVIASGTGGGQATHLGNWEVLTGSFCVSPDFTYTDGETIMLAANGDELWIEYRGTGGGQLVSPSQMETFWTGTGDIVGGTGRFAGANGEFEETGEALIEIVLLGSPPMPYSLGGTGSAVMTGWIGYDAASRQD